MARSGKGSLLFSRTDKNQYRLVTQNVPVNPGDYVFFSAWVKVENVVGESWPVKGASIYMESSDGEKYLSGEYPTGSHGTQDWKRISVGYRIPAKAASTSLGFYLNHKVTGKAWFDDVEVRIAKMNPFASLLQVPNYRGLVMQGNLNPWKILLWKLPHAQWEGETVTITGTLTDQAGNTLFTETNSVPVGDQETSLTITPPGDLPLGEYTWKLSYADAKGNVLQNDQHSIRIVEKMPKVFVVSEGFTVVDGQRFFPMGVYLDGKTSNDEDLRRVAEGNFNTVLSYLYGSGQGAGSYMESAASHRLKVLYSINQFYAGKSDRGEEADDEAAEYLKNFRNEPALLGWYINDELTEGWHDKVQARYNQIKQLDPDHLAFMVEETPEKLEQFALLADVLSMDLYPVGKGNLGDTSQAARQTCAAARGAKGVWIVPQIMDWAVYNKDEKPHPPTLDEMRNQAYQAIINGATGLIWYSYFDMKWEKFPRNDSTLNPELFKRRWADASAMAKEINAITPVVLANKKVPLDLPKDAKIEAAAWQDGEELVLMLANPYYEEKSVTLALPDGWRIKDAKQGAIQATSANGTATFTLPSMGSGVFRLVNL